MISTYAELQTAIANWLKRGNLSSRIPEFISLAEATINRRLRVRAMESRETFSLGSEYFDLTTLTGTFLEARNVQLNTDPRTTLDYLTPDQIDTFWSNSVGKPRSFTIIGDELQVRPAPDATYTAEISFYSPISALSDSNTTNWLLTNHPDIYLFAALYHGNLFIKDRAEAIDNLQLAEKYILELNLQDKKGRHSGAPLRPKVKTGYY